MSTESRTDGELADALYAIPVLRGSEDGRTLDEAARRLRAREGERIEGCEIGSSFFDGGSVMVRLPAGGSLHEMLGHPAILTILDPQEKDDYE